MGARRGAAGVDPYDKAAEAPSELVSFTGSFHGRTLGALVLTYKVRAADCAVHGVPRAPPGKRLSGASIRAQQLQGADCVRTVDCETRRNKQRLRACRVSD